MGEKQQFVSLLSSCHLTMSELCKAFGISRKTGHKSMWSVHADIMTSVRNEWEKKASSSSPTW
jgi:hypothetical protein